MKDFINNFYGLNTENDSNKVEKTNLLKENDNSSIIDLSEFNNSERRAIKEAIEKALADIDKIYQMYNL